MLHCNDYAFDDLFVHVRYSGHGGSEAREIQG
jgi:hypothetical protein